MAHGLLLVDLKKLGTYIKWAFIDPFHSYYVLPILFALYTHFHKTLHKIPQISPTFTPKPLNFSHFVLSPIFLVPQLLTFFIFKITTTKKSTTSQTTFVLSSLKLIGSTYNLFPIRFHVWLKLTSVLVEAM